jgi:prepilin-type N-terminal cleavage/methylation domain-containing protein
MRKFFTSKIENTKFGFTLIETIVSVAIFAMLIVGIIALVSFILTNNTQQTNLLTNNEQALHVAFNIMTEFRNATTSANGSYPIDTAADQQLIFYSNNGATVNRINYYIQSGVLKKGVTTPTGSPPVYNLGQEVVTTVQNSVANGATPLFVYYDDTYNGVTDNPLTQPVSVSQVKFIKINLKIYNKAGLIGTNSYTVSAGGAIRNLKTNLGN